MNELTIKSDSKPPCYREDALAVLQRLRAAGHTAYFAGGCVRDELMGIEPKDYDVATDAPPTRVRELFGNTQAVGAAFGVILVHHDRSVIEVATFRTDDVYLDGRRPSQVHFTTAEEDAKRRDFTINGLFLDPIDGRVIDFVGGQTDLQNRLLRAIGEPAHRFEEDHLRLLRAVRFAARFNLTIEPATASAIRSHAPQLARISPERIADELRRMLMVPSRVLAWQMLKQFHLLDVILRFLPRSTETQLRQVSSSPLFPALAPDFPIGFGLALAGIVLSDRMRLANSGSTPALLADSEIRVYEQACRKALKISNEESEQMLGALKLAGLLQDAPPAVAAMKRFLAGPYAPEARLLLHAIGQSDRALTARIDWLETQFAALLAEGDVAPTPLVTGDDLTAAGLRPGRIFKRILDEVYDAQLEARLKCKEEAMEMALRIARAE